MNSPNKTLLSETPPNETLQKIVSATLRGVLAGSKTLAPLLQNETIMQKALAVRRLSGGNHGANFAIELPFVAAKVLRTSPMEIAQQLASLLLGCTHGGSEKMFASVVVAKPGFVNITFSHNFRSYLLANLHTGSLTLNTLQGMKILLEYVSANPTGPLHVGHGRWAAIGSTVAALLRNCGAKVHSEFYVNDGGHQIALLKQSAAALRSGTPIPEGGYRGAYLQQFCNHEDPSIAILQQQKQHLEKVGAHFENFFHESSLKGNQPGNVEEVLEMLQKNGLAYKKDDALWFSSTSAGDDKDRVLIKSNGEKTYFAMDVAYHYTKIKRGYSHLIDILGADHHGYVARISTASELMYAMHTGASKKEINNAVNKHKNKNDDGVANFSIRVLVGQLISLFRDGKELRMSKRTGEMVAMDEVVEEIGVDAFRYFLLAQSINKKIDFDLTLAKQKSMDNPVYYLQYAHARSHSLIKKAKEVNLQPCEPGEVNLHLIAGKEMEELVNVLLFYKDELRQMGNSLGVHHLPHYLHEMASAFHSLYNAHQFIRSGSENEKAQSRQYLFLVATFQRILAHGLGILGINAPSVM